MDKHDTLADLDPCIIVEPSVPASSAVIWLHGLGADGHDFEGILPQLNLPKNHAIRFVFPHAPVQPVTVNGGMAMRSWYDIYSMTIAERVDIEGINQSSGVVKALIEQQVAQGIAADKIVLAGFSQGGLVVLHAALHSKQPIAGVIALSTYYPSVCWQEAMFQKNSAMPIFMAHGNFDPVIPLSVAQKSKAFLESLNLQVEWHTYPMEHSVCMPEIEHISSWLTAQLL
ncbi:alpha/beta hydrolase [Thiomicrorhabdus sp. Kp2]|uniref:alpha/beta hydrolase n=1 Tax=Thiomicrorhabdus sp. Kp2 TaxID=1123518 RepID=UPI0003FA77D4|nr:dienelactone hydrolase family protein [Thiomicrorhabdus sp. Kp2]